MASRSVLVNGNRAATFLTAPEPARVGAVSCSQVRGRASRNQSRAIGMLDGGAAASSGKTLRILLVDDSPADRELVKRAFRVVIDRVLGKRTLALEVERRQRQVAQYAKQSERQSERQVEDQTVALRRALQESEALGRVSRALAAARELKPALDLVTQAT